MPGIDVAHRPDLVEVTLPEHLSRTVLAELAEFGRTLTPLDRTVVLRLGAPGHWSGPAGDDLAAAWTQATQWTASPSHTVIALLPGAVLRGMAANLASCADLRLADPDAALTLGDPGLDGRLWPIDSRELLERAGAAAHLQILDADRLAALGYVHHVGPEPAAVARATAAAHTPARVENKALTRRLAAPGREARLAETEAAGALDLRPADESG
ncbi:Clp protease/crotonase-like domain-containing protein [Salininema proteolyticum]|uniref:Uncharacterized protein n=1 Tax=Salininema proteolyticum TaxID=1607685 RepID=A0ABV8TXR9_9ACTN